MSRGPQAAGSSHDRRTCCEGSARPPSSRPRGQERRFLTSATSRATEERWKWPAGRLRSPASAWVPERLHAGHGVARDDSTRAVDGKERTPAYTVGGTTYQSGSQFIQPAARRAGRPPAPRSVAILGNHDESVTFRQVARRLCSARGGRSLPGGEKNVDSRACATGPIASRTSRGCCAASPTLIWPPQTNGGEPPPCPSPAAERATPRRPDRAHAARDRAREFR